MVALKDFLSFVALLLPLAVADVHFTKPAAGDVITGTSLVATWSESGQKPALLTFSSYSLFLCAGGNNSSDYINLFNLQPYATYVEGNEWTGAISTGWGGNGTDAYFLLMVSTSACGGTIKNFSNRFTISSMAGSFPPTVVQGIQSIGGETSGPPTDQSDAGPALACTVSIAAQPVATSSASSATVTSMPSTTSSAVAGTSTSNPLSSSKSITLSTGALAGIIVTSMLIFATICGIATCIFLRLRKRRMQPQSPISSFKPWMKRNKEMERSDSTDYIAELSETAVCKEMDADRRHPTELSTVVRAELPARRSIYELPGS